MNEVRLEACKKVSTPVMPYLRLEALKDRNNPDGDQKRYFKVYVKCDRGIFDITRMCSNATGLRYSRNGCVIVHGCGMDMGFDLVDKTRKALCCAGHDGVIGQTYAGLL